MPSQGWFLITDILTDICRDTHGRIEREIIAIDAQMYNRGRQSQYQWSAIERELNKAYLGFSLSPSTCLTHDEGIATGNWGCGAFGGDVQLKSLIQLMAAVAVQRDVRYFTFGDPQFGRQLESGQHPLHTVYQYLCASQATLQDLSRWLQSYANVSQRMDVYQHIMISLTKHE